MKVYLLVYADGIIVTGDNQLEICKTVQPLYKMFSIKDMGNLSYFLGIEISRKNPSEICLGQMNYAMELSQKTKMDLAKPIPTPIMVSSHQLSKNKDEGMTNVKQYRSTAAALQYMKITRPDSSYSVNKICQFMR